MGNTSATGGPLLPNPPPAPVPLEGSALTDFFQQWFVGMTGLSGTLVRPQFQDQQPDIPQAGVVWMSFRYRGRPSDTFPYVGPDGTLQRHENIEMLCSFYDTGTDGQADYYAALLRDAMVVTQNLELLYLNNMGIRTFGNLTTVPVVVKGHWQYQVDFDFVITREIIRQYPIETIESVDATLYTDTGLGPQQIVVDNS